MRIGFAWSSCFWRIGVPLAIAGNVGMIAWDLGEGLYEHLKKNKR